MKDLTKGKPSKLIIRFALPLFVGNIFQLLYNLVDTRIIGSKLGTDALAAVGATSTMNNLIIGFLIGLTNGFAILTAKDFGAGNEKAMKKDIVGTFLLGSVIAMLLTLVSVVFLIPILTILHMPQELMAEGSAYIRIILLGMITAMLYNVCASTLRAIGDTISPLIFLIISVALNVVLDYLFILKFHFGVKGAAYATVVAQLGSAIMCGVYMYLRYPKLRLKHEDFCVEKKRVLQLLTTGISMGMMQSLVSLGTFALQRAINSFGTYTIVAHAAARRITELFMLPFSAFGMTMATYCGQNRGAGRLDRVKEGIKETTRMAWLWCGLVLIASYTVSPWLIQTITATKEQEIIDTAVLYLKVDTLLYAVPALISILRNALQGLGNKYIPVFSSFIELAGKVAVVIFLAPHLGYMGIILAEPIVWVVMVIPLIICTHQNLKTV